MNQAACHCVNLRRATSALTDHYSRLLGPSGLSLPQFSLLKNLADLGNCSTTDLARRVRLEHSTLVRNLHLLEAQGLVSDKREQGRKRSVWHLTDKGRRALATGLPLWEQAQNTVEQALGEEGLARFNELLEKLQALGESR